MYISMSYFTLLLLATAYMFYTLPKQSLIIQLLVLLAWITGLIYVLTTLSATPAKVYTQVTQLV